MSALAREVHRSEGRVRFRLPDAKGDTQLLERIEVALRRFPGVDGAEANPRTGSILVRHRADVEAIERYARERGLFEVEDEEPRAPLDDLRERILALDRLLDLKTLSIAALVSSGVYQIARGHVLPAGTALLIQATAMLVRGTDAPAATRT